MGDNKPLPLDQATAVKVHRRVNLALEAELHAVKFAHGEDWAANELEREAAYAAIRWGHALLEELAPQEGAQDALGGAFVVPGPEDATGEFGALAEGTPSGTPLPEVLEEYVGGGNGVHR
jgi:hypothetical protein